MSLASGQGRGCSEADVLGTGSFFSNKSLKCKYYNELGLLITLNRIACLGYQVQTVEINQDGQVVEAGISHTESLTGVLATELWLSYWVHRELLKKPPRLSVFIAEVLEGGIVHQLKSMGILKASIFYARWMLLKRQYFKTIQREGAELRALVEH